MAPARQFLGKPDDQYSVCDPWRSAEQVEAELRARLAGARLIFEIGLDEALYRRLAAIVDGRLRAGWDPERFRRRLPAIYATYLVLVGVFDYRRGGLWPLVPERLISRGTSEAGLSFVIALRKLGLEPFDDLVEEDHAAQYVGRIFAHGGIPVTCLEPFLRLLAREAAAGATDAAELIASWRARHARLDVLHQPARRFILYGGATAVDLVDRCLELVRSPETEDSGLPSHIVDAARQLPAPEVRAASTGVRVPAPTLRIDPYDGLGPVVALPLVPRALRDGSWRVEDGRGLTRHAASALTSTTVRTAPARTYEADYESIDGRTRRWTFEALDRVPALLFDPRNGQALRDPTAVSSEEVWVLAHEDVGLTAFGHGSTPVTLRDVQELPSPGGAWARFKLRHLDLRDVTKMQIGDAQVFVVPRRPQPLLSGSPVEGVATAEGFPVYSRMPTLDLPALPDIGSWRIILRREGEPATVVDPGDPLPGADGRYSLTVRGPLGSDLRAAFAVIEGFEVERPRHVLLPHHGPAVVRARAASAELDGAPPGTWVELAIEGDGAIATGLARVPDAEPLELHVQVPRLLWAIVHEGKPALRPSATLLRVGREEFEDEHADLLTVRTGRPGVPLQLDLLDGSRQIHASQPVTTGGRDGRWSFDLAEFADHIRASDAGVLRLELRVGTSGIAVADIVAQIVISQLTATTRLVGDFTSVTLRFAQDRPVQKRVARLWSITRPWEDPVEERVPEGQMAVELRGYGRIPPGRYLAEIAVEDAWLRARRPTEGAPGVRFVRVGEREDDERRLGDLDPNDPLTALEWAIAGFSDVPKVTGARLAERAVEAATALRCLVEGVPPGEPSPVALRRLSRLLCTDASVLGRVLLAGAEEAVLERGQMLRLGLRLVADVAGGRPVGDGDARALWRVAPVVAAAIDVPAAARGFSSAVERCETMLGWTPGDRLDPLGGQVDRTVLASSAEELCQLRRYLDLHPPRLLDAAALMEATFEWLIALASCGGDEGEPNPATNPRDWYFAWNRLCREPVGNNCVAELERHLRCRLPSKGTVPWARLPIVSLMAATHLVAGSPSASAALAALDHAAGFAPRLVEHDVLLALTFLHAKG